MYLPSKSNSLTLNKIEKAKRSSMEEVLDEASSNEVQIVHTELANPRSKIQAFKNLTAEVWVDDLSSNNIFVQYKDSLFGQNQLMEQNFFHAHQYRSLTSKIKSET